MGKSQNQIQELIDGVKIVGEVMFVLRVLHAPIMVSRLKSTPPVYSFDMTVLMSVGGGVFVGTRGRAFDLEKKWNFNV